MIKRRLHPRMAIVVLLFIFGFILSNWNQLYRFAYDSERSANGPIANYDEFQAERFSEFLAAGFPLTHSLRICDEGLPEYSVFNWFRWFSNFAIWLVLLCAVLLYQRNIERRRPENGKRQLYVTDLLVITSTIAACLAAWRYHEARFSNEQELSDAISNRGGSMVRSVWLPGNMIGGIAVNVSRTRSAQIVLKEADNVLLRRVLQLERLTSLCLDGGDYDLKMLNDLSEKPLLRELRISGRTITPELIQSIGRIEQLKSLNLMNTSVTVEDLQKLNGLSRLQYLVLLDTDVPLSEISTLPFASNLRGLVVPRPGIGGSERITIVSWPRLEHFVVSSRRQPRNKTDISIELNDLPKLLQVKIDCVLPVDIKLTNLPSLAIVDAVRISQGDLRNFGGLRAGNLQVKNVPRLKSLKLHGPDLETIELHAPNLQSLAILENGLEKDVDSSATFPTRLEIQSRLPSSVLTQTVLDGLAGSVGPRQLEIYADLSNASLAPVFQNKSLQSIDLSRSLVKSKQLAGLGGIEHLNDIWLGDILMSGKEDDATWLTQEFAMRSKVHVLGHITGIIDIENNRSLTTLRLRPSTWEGYPVVLAIDGLRLVRVTNLKDNIVIENELNFLQIVESPSITGLSFRRPLPKGTSINGLRDLTHFDASGPNLTDEVLSAVLECPNLKELSITDSCVSKEGLCRLNSLTQLQSLQLSGSQVDETVMRAFVSIPSLTQLILRNTKIDNETIDLLKNAPSGTKLSIYLVQCEFEKKKILELAEERPSFQIRTTPGFN
jgi:hypothetical protein